MLLELGNQAARMADGSPAPADGHRVTYVHVPDVVRATSPDGTETEVPNFDPAVVAGADLDALSRHILTAPGGVTNAPGLEPLLAVLHPSGLWAAHSSAAPTWVASDTHPQVAAKLAEFFGVPAARPADVEDTHWTRAGMPGVGFDPLAGAVALKTNAGNDIQAWQMFNAGQVLGQTGTATATSSTSLTGGTETPGGSHASNDAVGMTIVAWGNGTYGYVTANTSGTTPVYTVDRWYAAGTPGGAAGSTPGSTTGYTLLTGSLPAYFMGLTANSTTPGSGDTTLTGEITTASGGLIRKICPTAHTAGTNSLTLTPVFTANGSDSLPVTIAKIGVSQSITSGVKQLFQTLLSATATLSSSGDQLTVTETVST